MTDRGFQAPTLDPADVVGLAERARVLRGAILTMTSLAASGHPGGSMSSLELYQVLYGYARLRPDEPAWPERDRVFVSHGHTSPGVYCALADNGFFELEDAVAHFRQAGSIFEGHVERSVPGVEWSSGNLGQGLSAGVGAAIAARVTGWRLAHVRRHVGRRADEGPGGRGATPRGEVPPVRPHRCRRPQPRPDLRATRARSCRSTSPRGSPPTDGP